MEEVSCVLANEGCHGGSSGTFFTDIPPNDGPYTNPRLESGDEGERCVALRLPREVSRRVFSQLDYRDLVQCSLVCKQWHSELAELRQGWKEELIWESCSIRGVHFDMNEPPPSRPPSLDLYFAGSLD